MRRIGSSINMKDAEMISLRSWNNAETKDCRLRIVNSSDTVVDILWVQHDGQEKSYRQLQPGGVHLQATYTTHVWRLRTVLTRRLLLEHIGGDATIELVPDDSAVEVHEGYQQDIVPRGGTKVPKEWGKYRTRALSKIGIPIMAWDVVGDDAVVAAADILERMCQDSPADVLQRMVAAGCDVAIIGRGQVTSDIPAHSSLKGENAGSGRTFDDGCRGVGGSLLIPTTSAGEENCTMISDKFYPSEQILTHEFGHTVMDVGVAKADRDAIAAAYASACQQQLYQPDCYMASVLCNSNCSEYWAEGTQAWFDATVRTDVNTGINTRAKLKRHDPTLANLLMAAYGDGTWRYPQTAPQPFVPHRTAGRRKPQPRHVLLGIHRLFGRCLPHKRHYVKVV